MSRLAPSLAILIAASAGFPAFAADYGAEPDALQFRSGYQSYEPKDWTDLGQEGDGIHIETGLRYWYSMGTQAFGLPGGSITTSDTAHNGEAYMRIDDDATRTYLKGIAGYSAAITGTYDLPKGEGSIVGGQIGYAGADFGWHAFGNEDGGVGVFAGYQYWNDSPRSARDNYATISSASDIDYNPATGLWSFGVDGVERNIDMNLLRLGFSGKVKAGPFDISAEAAAVPYAKVDGLVGGNGSDFPDFPLPGCDTIPPGDCGTAFARTSPLTIDGSGYGAMGELMVGMTPVENLTFRVGGRAWYLQGTYDATYTGATITPPQQQAPIPNPDTPDPNDTMPPDPLYSAPAVSTNDYVSTNNPWSMFRYGLLAELTYSF